MKYNDNGEYKDIYVKAFDTLPIGTEVDYDGSTVPSGWTEIPDPNTYSTDEVRVGTWIDGKPLYRKVVTASASASSTFNIIDSSVNTIVKTTTYLTTDTGQVLPIPYYIDGNTYGYGNNYQNNYIYTGKGTAFTAGTLMVIIEYTKTTD